MPLQHVEHGGLENIIRGSVQGIRVQAEGGGLNADLFVALSRYSQQYGTRTVGGNNYFRSLLDTCE